MDMTYKKRAVNTGFGFGVALIMVGLLMIWFAPPVWSGWATFVVAAGLLAAFVGVVFALIPTLPRR